MKELVVHFSETIPSSVKLPFLWRTPHGGNDPAVGELGFVDGALAAFDGEQWQHFDFQKLLQSIRPSPKGFAAEPLARALGLIKQPPKTVIDASCGSGKDALQVWQWGYPVVAYERNPSVYALLWDALRRHPLPKFELRHGDASLEKFTSDEYVMFDPMFEQTDKKKSLPRKEMQLFKNLVGPDTDQSEVADRLFQSGAGRVVIKKPGRLKATPTPNHSLTGKTIRFDVYLSSAL